MRSQKGVTHRNVVLLLSLFAGISPALLAADPPGSAAALRSQAAARNLKDEQLLEILKDQASRNAEKDKIPQFIKQLGADDFEKRDEASRKLV